MNLTHLTDRALLSDTKALAQEYRRVTLKLLHHLKEIERRRLFSDLGYSSLFDYVVKDLGFSESSAIRRIHAARLLIEIPEIESKIESGSLTLSNLSQASHFFKEDKNIDLEKKKEIISQIENLSTRKCEQKLNDLKEGLDQKQSINILKFELSDETITLLEDLKSLLAHRKLSQNDLMSLIFKAALKTLTQKKFHLLTTRETKSTNPRYITALMKKHIYERDKGRCQKCQSKFALEIDHVKPFALGGRTLPQNLRLLCRSCNQRGKIQQFGLLLNQEVLLTHIIHTIGHEFSLWAIARVEVTASIPTDGATGILGDEKT
jgi:hypothetical protein